MIACRRAAPRVFFGCFIHICACPIRQEFAPYLLRGSGGAFSVRFLPFSLPCEMAHDGVQLT